MMWQKYLFYPALLSASAYLYPQGVFDSLGHQAPLMKNELPVSTLLHRIKINNLWQDKQAGTDSLDNIPGIMHSAPMDVDDCLLIEDDHSAAREPDFNFESDIDIQPVQTITLPENEPQEFFLSLKLKSDTKVTIGDEDENSISAFSKWAMGDRTTPAPEQETWEEKLLKIFGREDDSMDDELSGSDKPDSQPPVPQTSIIYTTGVGQWIIVSSGGSNGDGSGDEDGGGSNNEGGGGTEEGGGGTEEGGEESEEGGREDDSSSSSSETGGREPLAGRALVCHTDGASSSTPTVQCVNCGLDDIHPDNLAGHLLNCEQVNDQTKGVMESLLDRIEELSTAGRPGTNEGSAGKVRLLEAATNDALSRMESLSAKQDKLKTDHDGRIQMLQAMVTGVLQSRLEELSRTDGEMKKQIEELSAELVEKLRELEPRLQELELSPTDGILWYVLKGFDQYLTTQQPLKVTTFSVRTGPRGYKNTFQISLQGQTLVIHHVLMGDYYDSFQTWPFKAKISITLLHPSDSSHHVKKLIMISHKKMEDGINSRLSVPPARFMTLQQLAENGFISNNELLFKFKIELQSQAESQPKPKPKPEEHPNPESQPQPKSEPQVQAQAQLQAQDKTKGKKTGKQKK